MTRLLRHALVLSALLVAFAAPSAANAATAEACQTQIDALATATDSATFIGKNAEKEEAGLLRTLAGASETLAAGKLADTVKKLSDFRIKAVAHGEDGKLNPADAEALVQLTDDAIACVTSIGG